LKKTPEDFAWELLWLVLALVAAYLLALWKGEQILDRAAEKRRLKDWARVGGLIQWRLHLALVRAFSAGLLTARLPKTSTGVAGTSYFAQWILRLEEILGRTANSRVMKEDLRHDDDLFLVVGVSKLLPHVKEAHSNLFDMMVGFQDSMPTRLRQALALVVLRMDEFRESVKDLAPEVIMNGDRDHVGIQLHQNCYLAKDLFIALEELLRALEEALPKGKRRVIDLRNTAR
jgi:hypothetical protein